MHHESGTTRRLIQTALKTCGAGAVLVAASLLGPAVLNAEDKWVIEIRPLETENTAAVSGVAPAPAVQGPAEAPGSVAPGVLVPRMTYAQALAQIPFSRAEYEANPSYRHDSAMELMFGAMRPTTIVKQNIPYFSRYPDFFRNRFQVFPYQQGSSMNFNYLWSTNAYTNSW